MAEALRLVIDADVNKRVATELNARGRQAVAVSEVDLHRREDEPLLRGLVTQFGAPESWILVTGDDAMPDEHGDLLAELGVTLATLDPRQPAGLSQDAWRRDVVHRWAHAIGRQGIGTIRRYSLHRHGLWRPRRSGKRR